jgi:hypothetical protein
MWYYALTLSHSHPLAPFSSLVGQEFDFGRDAYVKYPCLRLDLARVHKRASSTADTTVCAFPFRSHQFGVRIQDSHHLQTRDCVL